MTAFNYEQARYNMIEQQIRTWNVLDEDVLNLLMRLPREDFVPAKYKEHAFTDMSIPLGNGEEMLPPKFEALMLQTLKIQPQENVLEVGTGSGYVTALLASMAGHVISVDIDPNMQKTAAENLAAHQIKNVTLEVGDAAQGWDAHKPYDVIVITGSLPILPESFQRALKVGGRLFAIVGDAPSMDVILITRSKENEWVHKILLETSIPALMNAPEPERFAL